MILSRLFKDTKGFSIIEAMVALGIMGAGALVMMKMNQNQVASQKTAETSFEMQAVVSAATSALLDKNICTETFKGMTIVNGMNITRILKPNPTAPTTPTVIVATNTPYGNGMVQINSMIVNLDGPLMDVGSEKFGTGSITLDVQKLNKSAQNRYDMKKRLGVIIRFKTTPAGVFLSCYSDADANSDNLKTAMCESLGGVWGSPIAERCNLQNTAVDHVNAASTKYVQDQDVLKVNKAGDTMTGSLTISNGGELNLGPSHSISAGQICVGGSCRALSNQVCGDDARVFSISANGTITCKALPTCSNGFYLQGINSNGQPICKNLPGNQCGAGQYIKTAYADGSVDCAPIPASAGVPQIDYSFFDGYDSNTNSWSRKSIDQVAQQICARFNGYTWDGSKCNGASGGGADVWKKYSNRIEYAPTGSDFKLIIYDYGYTSWEYKGQSSAAITVNGTSLGAHGPGGILFLNPSADNTTTPSRSTTFSHGRMYMNGGDISLSNSGGATSEIDFGYNHKVHTFNGVNFDADTSFSITKNGTCSGADRGKLRYARINNDANNTRLFMCVKENSAWKWKEIRWFD